MDYTIWRKWYLDLILVHRAKGTKAGIKACRSELRRIRYASRLS